MTTNDWMNILFGGAGVTGTAAIVAGLKWLWQRHRQRSASSKRHRNILGTYQGYHLACVGNGRIIRSVMTLSTPSRPKGPIVVSLTGSQGFRYDGELHLFGESKNIFIVLRGESYPERVLFVFNEPASPEFIYLTGVYTAAASDWIPVCGIILMLKKAQPDSPIELDSTAVDPRIVKFLQSQPNPIRVRPTAAASLDDLA
jgi:hypothetical protein